MTFLNSTLTRLFQRVNRRLNTAYLESLYQGNYLSLAGHAEWLKDVPLASPTGGTASFSLLYILLSILVDKGPAKILELGAGQSTKLLAQYADAFGRSVTVIDEDERWLSQVMYFSSRIIGIHGALEPRYVSGKKIHWYGSSVPKERFNLVVVDGPMAYKRMLAYNRLGILDWLPEILEEEFIIIVDDANRKGERLLVSEMLQIFLRMSIKVLSKTYCGATAQCVIETPGMRKYLYI